MKYREKAIVSQVSTVTPVQVCSRLREGCCHSSASAHECYLLGLLVEKLFETGQGNGVGAHVGGDGKVCLRGGHFERDLLVEGILDNV